MKLKVGDVVLWRGSFGTAPAKRARVIAIELCHGAHEKDGDPVDEVESRLLGRCCVDLDNGHWAYGDQISLLR
jgi:hypothetical protein